MQIVSLKSLQEDAADDISRRHFQMQFFLVPKGLTPVLAKINSEKGSCESKERTKECEKKQTRCKLNLSLAKQSLKAS